MSAPERGAATVTALFDDPIDARLALDALRKADAGEARVSLLVAVDDDRADAEVDVGRAVDDADLGRAAGWLLGLSTLVVPGCGPVLAAGPLGAALSEMAFEAAEEPGPDEEPAGEGIASLLVAFGFGEDEAGYIGRRVAAGSPLVAVGVEGAEDAAGMRRLLADADAVHIGTADTPERTRLAADALLAAPPEAAGHGAVEIADAVGPLVRDGDGGAAGLAGRPVVDRDGERAGEIAEVLVEERTREARWIVVGNGGVLGIGRRLAAVPAACVDLDADPVRLRITAEALREAPEWSADQPFSRHEELAAFRHFGLSPYWDGALGCQPAGG